MIDIYTEKKDSKDWIIKNDLFTMLTTFHLSGLAIKAL